MTPVSCEVEVDVSGTYVCMHSRRRMLRSSATLLTGCAVGAVTAGRIASEASAADASLVVGGDSVEVRNETLQAVTLDLTVAWEYSVPSAESPQMLAVDVLAGTGNEDLSVVASSESQQVFLENSGEESFSVDLLAEEVVSADDMVPAEKGASTDTAIVVGTELRVLDDSDMVIAADAVTDTATVTITRDDYDPDAHGTVSGEGSVSVSVE